MASDLQQTWDDIAYYWDDWEPPLRPCEQDLEIMQRALARWHESNPVKPVRVFLLGVTPEIATMHWPFPIELVGMDQAESMVRVVWPGDVPGVRRAVRGNWLHSGLSACSQDVVLADGSFVFFGYPSEQRELVMALAELLKPGGLLLCRHYAQVTPQETFEGVLDAVRAKVVGNFHVFKWRLAMALQPNSRRGVQQSDIWHACTEAGIDYSTCAQPGWSDRAINTIHFYRNKQARLYFPTLEEFAALLSEVFQETTVYFPSYELGERCPILAARRP